MSLEDDGNVVTPNYAPVINYKSVKAGSTAKCAAALVKLIKDEGWNLNRIVSISIHDTQVHHGDLEAVVWYKKHENLEASIVEDSESLSYECVVKDEDVNWSQLNDEIME